MDLRLTHLQLNSLAETVSSLSSEHFINCLQRMISRYGRPHTIFSDNTTNLVGANNYLKSAIIHAQNFTAEEQIHWSFIPPQSPRRGGIWEAAIKFARYHLIRVLKGDILDYEEYYTLLTRIEGLCCSVIPDTPEVLTPGHLLIGDSLTSPSQLETATPTLDRRYILLKNYINSFWHVS